MKSKFYGLDLASLYAKKAVRLRRTKNEVHVEYVFAYNWSPEFKATHPNFADYAIRCVGKTARGVPFRAGAITVGKHAGHWFYQYGPELGTVETILADPASIYEYSNEQLHNLNL